MKSNKVFENVKFNFTPEFKITESEKGMMNIGGVALTECISNNKRKYTFEHIQENNNKSFKWLVGHPKEAVEDHVIGKGMLVAEGNVLKHDGHIMNTARHPDVIEKVKAGLLGPSIHARAKTVSRDKDGNYDINGLIVEGIGLVAFQGVKEASIDYAIAESFEEMESTEDANNKDKGDIMTEEKPEEKPEEKVDAKPEEKPEEKVEEKPEEAPKAEESTILESLQKEVETLKNDKKKAIVESIKEINPKLEEAKLMSESMDKLELIKEYEQKLSTTESHGIVESQESDNTTKIIQEKDGSIRLSEQSWNEFNTELRERI